MTYEQLAKLISALPAEHQRKKVLARYEHDDFPLNELQVSVTSTINGATSEIINITSVVLR